MTVFIQFQFHIYIPGWIGGRSDGSWQHLEETLWQGKLGAKLEFLGQTRLKTLQTLWHLGEVKLAWWCLFPVRAGSSPGSWSSRSCTDTRGWDTSQTLWSYQVRSGDHYVYPGDDRVFIDFYSSRKCNRDSNQSLFPLRKTKQTKAFRRIRCNTFSCIQCTFWSQLLSSVRADIDEPICRSFEFKPTSGMLE